MSEQPGRIQLYVNDAGQYQFRFIGTDHRILMYGPAYGSREDAQEVLDMYFSNWTVEDGTGE